MNIYPITYSDLDDWLEMSLDLWPEESREKMRGFLESFIEGKKYHNFIGRNEQGEPLGFINLSIRSDYVEGSSGSPVVFIEGIYTMPAYRKQGVASKLMQAGEEWGRKQGCSEMASDAYTDNTVSRAFHVRAGFTEAPPIVVFVKKI